MLQHLPHEINNLISNYLLIPITTIDTIKQNCNTLYTYALFDNTLHSKLTKYKQIMLFFKKYYVYQKEYSYSYIHNFKNIYFTNPILCDILFTGLNIPFSKSSFNKINDTLFEDLKEIIKLLPDTLHSTWCHLRCRTHVTPLYAACLNEHIPLHIVEYLLEHGSNIKTHVRVNGVPRTILNDIEKECKHKDRFNKLVDLFNAYDK